MTNKKLDFSTAPEFVQQFESENIEYLKQLRFYNWPLWQIIKVPVFYKLLQTDSSQLTDSPQKKRAVDKIVNAYKEIKSFLKIFLGGSKKDSILCVTHNADCLYKKEEKFYNSLFDYIISQKTQYPICHWEYTSFTKSPRFNEPQVKIEAAESFFLRINEVHVETQQQVTEKFMEIWNKYTLLKNIDGSSITEDFVNRSCGSFYKSYLFWKSSLKKKRPSKIFSSEKMGTGMLAAANELKIPFYEFQHGNIDKNYPPYVWNEGWNKVENRIKPDYLVLFGKMAKSIALATGFFNAKEIATVGYEKIESYRSRHVADSGYVFFALQPFMNELNKLIIEEIKRLSKRYKIAIKYHPLQSQQEVDEYNNLLKESNVKIFSKSKNIYDCIQESKVIVSHVSTVLEEALSLGKLSVTIVTENLPQGIHSMTGNLYLNDVIIPASINNLSNLFDTVVFKNNLSENVNGSLSKFQFEIYESNYYSNILKLVKNGTD